MKLVVISPENEYAGEPRLLAALFAEGLERYHLRKPGWSSARLEAWLGELPEEYYSRIVLHQHHELVARFGLGGRHWRDEADAPMLPPDDLGFTSRACHSLGTLRKVLGHFDAVLAGAVFASISKPGHGPRMDLSVTELRILLTERTPAERRTAVFALGGVNVDKFPACAELGFDGVAVLGAVWNEADPLRAFRAMQQERLSHVG
jgi:thiamine-phosphate pyrophosphorylase